MKDVTAKKKCCQDKPRCKRCPLALQRLVDLGYAERDGGRRFRVAKVPKKVLKTARSR